MAGTTEGVAVEARVGAGEGAAKVAVGREGEEMEGVAKVGEVRVAVVTGAVVMAVGERVAEAGVVGERVVEARAVGRVGVERVGVGREGAEKVAEARVVEVKVAVGRAARVEVARVEAEGSGVVVAACLRQSLQARHIRTWAFAKMSRGKCSWQAAPHSLMPHQREQQHSMDVGQQTLNQSSCTSSCPAATPNPLPPLHFQGSISLVTAYPVPAAPASPLIGTNRSVVFTLGTHDGPTTMRVPLLGKPPNGATHSCGDSAF